MKLIEALEIGNDQKLQTVGECINYIESNPLNLFEYTDIDKELEELDNDFYSHRITRNMDIVDALFVLLRQK
jgi:hypothetical protein